MGIIHTLAGLTLIATACFTWVLVILALIKYVFGKQYAHIQTNTQEPTKTQSKAKIKPTEQTDEQRQHNTLMANIDNYNGTGQKQEKVR